MPTKQKPFEELKKENKELKQHLNNRREMYRELEKLNCLWQLLKIKHIA